MTRRRIARRANAFARWLRTDTTRRMHGAGFHATGLPSLDAFRRAARLALAEAWNVQQTAEDCARAVARTVRP